MRVLAVSPHLDDAAFSAGATLAALADAGHDVVVVTVFTGSVPDPTGFALACQTDKGLAPDVDYMALRRAEDAAAQAVLGTAPVHLPLREAPHRGYGSAPELFAGVHPGDVAWRRRRRRARADGGRRLARTAGARRARGPPAGRARGRRARPSDGVVARRAVRPPRRRTRPPSPDLPDGLTEVELPGDRDRRADACACYATQLGFQFGGPEPMRAALAALGEPLLADDAALALLRDAVPGARLRS